MEYIKTLDQRNIFMYFESNKKYRQEVRLNEHCKMYSVLEFEDAECFEHYFKVATMTSRTQEIESIEFEDRLFELCVFFKEFDFSNFEFFEDDTSYYALSDNEVVILNKEFKSIQHQNIEYKIHESHILTPVLAIDFRFILSQMINSLLVLDFEYSSGLPF